MEIVIFHVRVVWDRRSPRKSVGTTLATFLHATALRDACGAPPADLAGSRAPAAPPERPAISHPGFAE